jgi:putative aldouronate transport system permease protein
VTNRQQTQPQLPRSGRPADCGRFIRREPVWIHGFFILACLLCLVPLILIIAISFSREDDLIRYGFRLIPLRISFDAYTMIFQSPARLLRAYQISLFTTAVGTVIHLTCTAMMAYALSRPYFRLRRFFSFYIFFTMLFSGGLVPYYILMTQYLRLSNNVWALIVPFMFGAYNAFLMRTNFQALPMSISESAKIDGAGEFSIFIRLILPLSAPTVATVGLFVSLSIWNDWYQSLLFINKPRLYSLQMMLQMMLASVQAIQNDMNSQFARELLKTRRLPAESLKMAMCLVAIGPIVVLFPFLQKYFVRGLTVGSIKG